MQTNATHWKIRRHENNITLKNKPVSINLSYKWHGSPTIRCLWLLCLFRFSMWHQLYVFSIYALTHIANNKIYWIKSPVNHHETAFNTISFEMLLINSSSSGGGDDNNNNSKHWYKLTNLKNEEKNNMKTEEERRQRVRKRFIRKNRSEIDVVKTKKHE